MDPGASSITRTAALTDSARRFHLRKDETSPRFGPERWVTLRDTGEHVKVEVWSAIAAAYRVR